MFATVIVDGDPLCPMHARIASAEELYSPSVTPDHVEAVRSVLPGTVCSRGCGNAPHRGRCAGPATGRRTDAIGLPEPAPIAESFEGKSSADGSDTGMDVLVCEEIPASQVPTGRERHIGRLGHLWLRLMATDFDKALKVACRDADHAGATARHMTLKARKAGVAIVSRKVGDVYFCQRIRPEAKR